MNDDADAAGRDASAAPAAAQVTAPSRSRLGPEEIAAYFRKRDLMLECVMEARMASSTGGSARSPKNGDAAGTSASPG